MLWGRLHHQRVWVSLLYYAGVLWTTAWESHAFEESATTRVSFYRQVRPLLQRACSGCHQPARHEGGLVLTSYQHLMSGGESGPCITVGKPDESLLVQLISGEKPEMPRGAEPLPPAAVEVIRRWIMQGAVNDTPTRFEQVIDQLHPPRYKQPPVINTLAYTPDGKNIAVNGYHEIIYVDANDGHILARFIGRSPRITSVVFSPDGQWLAATGGAPALFGELQVWDVATHKNHLSLQLGYDTLFGASFSDDSRWLAFGSFDNKARVVSVEDGRIIAAMDAHADLVFGTAFSLKGDHLITVSRDMSMKLTEIKTSQFLDNITSITPGALKGGLMTVRRHPSEEHVLTGGADGEPKLYQIFRTRARQIGDDFNRIRSYVPMPGRIFSLDFNRDGKLFVVGSSDATSGHVRIYETGSGNVYRDLGAVEGGVFAVAFRPDGQQVAAGGLEGIIRIYDVNTGHCIQQFIPVPLDVTEGISLQKK